MRFYRPTLAGLALIFGCALMLAPAPGRAQGGLLDFLFGPDPAPAPQAAPRRAPPDASHRRAKLQGDLRFAKPKDALSGGNGGGGFASEPAAGGFCVRTCDGYFFPLIKSTQATRQQSCELACPSAPMEIYDGATIETARNSRGQRYSALPLAFAFRDRANNSCVCNDPRGSQAFFEKTQRSDPTLKSGDILIEETGAFVYRSDKFVPLSNASFMSSTLRDRLRAMLRKAAAKSTSAETSSAATGEVSLGEEDRTGSTMR